MSRSKAVILLVCLAGGLRPAKGVSLAALIAGAPLPPAVGVQFANFSAGVSEVPAAQIDVTAFVDPAGNAVIRFTTAALAIGANGSNELLADVLFDASAPGSSIRSVTQSFAATVSAGSIAAYDFTNAGLPPTVTAVATACVGGAAGACASGVHTDSHNFVGAPATVRVERQVQLLRAKGSNATGSVSSFDAAFAIGGPAPPAATAPAIAAVTSGASYLAGPVSPGLIVTVWGDAMGPPTPVVATPGADGRFPKAVAGTQAFFDGVPAAVIFASRGQVGVVAPYSLSGKATAQLAIDYNGVRSNSYTLAVADAAPAIFSADASGAGPGAILNVRADGTLVLNQSSAPAPRGSYIVVYMTGEGQTDPGGTDGQVALAVMPKPLLKVSATVGGVAADVQYAGAAAYLVAGVMQVNLIVPADAASGAAVPVVVQVGDKRSQPGITVAIGN